MQDMLQRNKYINKYKSAQSPVGAASEPDVLHTSEHFLITVSSGLQLGE